MNNETQVPAGSQPINPLPEETVETVEAAEEVVADQPEVEVEQPDQPEEVDKVAALEKQLADSQKMIGQQGKQIGDLKAMVESSQKQPEVKEPEGPSQQERIDEILGQIDEGEIGLKEGIAQVLELNTNLTAANVMAQMETRQKESANQANVDNWHKENPDFQGLVEDGSLQPYMDNDPFADEYVAYNRYKADQEIQTLKEQHAAELKAAKEEGARLAKGADNAGKVIGKTGSAAQAAAVSQQVNKPFKNRQEGLDAMAETLRTIRGAAG